jgi:hypothetical protein
MHLSVLFIASEQHIGRCLESKVADIVPVDDGGGWDVGLALRLRGWRLHIRISIACKNGREKDNLWTGWRVLEPFIACIIHFTPKVDGLRRFTEHVERRH